MGVLDRFRLNGKRAFITGGSRGLGREMALGLAEAGADLILVGREQAALDQTAVEVRARGRQVATIQADVGQPAEAERACRTALAEHGPIDILINNVGGRRVDVPTQDMPTETWHTLIDLNLTSTFVCTKHLGGAMIARGRGGRIINIASISGLIANRGIGGRSYETGKAAVIAFTKAVAADWAPHRITVNAIAPGGFMTAPNLRWKTVNPAIIETFKAQVPMGEYGEPEDLAPLAVYLASDASRYMTGHELLVDGALSINGTMGHARD